MYMANARVCLWMWAYILSWSILKGQGKFIELFKIRHSLHYADVIERITAIKLDLQGVI